ncbi:MAG: FAD-binding oxidoreductase [Candidatus Levybacteria bacterium]|nr:FAD-binding oxidoreductase [Candidatus Levybacteria bacterium]
MNDNLAQQLKAVIKGDILSDEKTLTEYSHDASLFEVKPQVVVNPKDVCDLKALVKFVSENKKNNPSFSLTARSGGTDMGGGAINDSIVVAFQKYFNHMKPINNNIASVEPGVFYREFEEQTLKQGLIFPSYPASKEICCLGGIVNNNAGGEKSLKYGTTGQYVKRVRVVLSDGNEYEFKPLFENELNEKMKQENFEGEIYRKMYRLIIDNYAEIIKAKPDVSKNSAGYYLWNVWDKEKRIFDLTKLWVGAQGTLGLLVEADIQLVPIRKHRDMMIIFLHDLSHLSQIVKEVLSFNPESFEAYDDSTLKLALRFFPEFAKLLGTKGIIQTALSFLPEFFMIMFGGLPKLVLQVDFTGDNIEDLQNKIKKLKERLKPLHLQIRIAQENQEEKYWAIRRESFNLLRKKVRNKHTAPFIDDFIVKPEYLSKILPQVVKIIKKHPEFMYTIAGHVGDGNFHIIPLVDIANPNVRKNIPIIADQIYDLVIKYKGSITGEHNDGLIRTPYLKRMYGQKIISLFEETKNVFDSQNIFNPRKKVFGDINFAMNHIRQNW